MTYDLIVVGAGIVGLAHAYTAALRGWRVAVVERDHRCIGASVRNFGFVTVTGQRAGDTWRRALRSREVWAEVADRARIPIEHQGLWVLARRRSARAVLEAFAAGPMGEDCVLYEPHEAAQRMPVLRTEGASAALYSPHELRVESREAIARLAAWLSERHGVAFLFAEAVLDVQPHVVRTSRRKLHGGRVVICPGSDLTGVAAAALAHRALRLTRLQMLRVRPHAGFRLTAAVMGDLSLVRYAGYAALPQARVLRDELSSEVPQSLAHGIHLIAVQSSDGTLVVGDSHHDDASPLPFSSEEIDRCILRHLRETLDLGECEVVERWIGTYPVGHSEDSLVEAPDPSVRVVLVTSGTGASTAFGLAEDVLRAW